MIAEMIIVAVFGFIIGITFDYLLFRLWHGPAHSEFLKRKEKKQKKKESAAKYRSWR